MAAKNTVMIALSGGPLDGPVDGKKWAPGEEQAFEHEGRTWVYRRVVQTEDEDEDPMIAVLVRHFKTK